MRAAFGFSLEQYYYFGGYPGAAPLVADPPRWRRYLLDALIETTIARRLVESAVGAHLANAAAGGVCELFYWREGNREVDFVIRAGRVVVAIEVKSGRAPEGFPGLAAFTEAFKPKRTLIVGGDSLSVEEFLTRPIDYWL